VPYAERDGLRLFYERAGGGRELLFVPGWCCDHTWFQPQFEHFSRTHTVTALDLRGVGRSDVPADGYAIRDFADDVARLCSEVGIGRPVVVGHSLGGMIAVELAARHPELASALVLVDPGPIDPLHATVQQFVDLATRLAGPDGEAVRRAYVSDMGAYDGALGRQIADAMCAVPLPVAAAVIRGVNEWDGRAAFARCAVPVLLLRAELGPEPDAVRLQALKPGLQVGVTVGAGHFHQIEVADQVNAMIERFLSLFANV
jgi:pimeloyl-ACP methyl ester carboxylesterase